MTVIAARIASASDGTKFSRAPRAVPQGEQPVAITVPTVPAGRPFAMANFPVHDLGWADCIPLRREDMYGGDGR